MYSPLLESYDYPNRRISLRQNIIRAIGILFTVGFFLFTIYGYHPGEARDAVIAASGYIHGTSPNFSWLLNYGMPLKFPIAVVLLFPPVIATGAMVTLFLRHLWMQRPYVKAKRKPHMDM